MTWKLRLRATAPHQITRTEIELEAIGKKLAGIVFVAVAAKLINSKLPWPGKISDTRHTNARGERRCTVFQIESFH